MFFLAVHNLDEAAAVDYRYIAGAQKAVGHDGLGVSSGRFQ